MSMRTAVRLFTGSRLGTARPKLSPPVLVIPILLLLTMLLGGCSAEEIPPTPAQAVAVATAAAVPEFTATPNPPTATSEPSPTAEPTATDEPTAEPTATSVPPTATAVPTATPMPPLDGSGGGVLVYVSELENRAGIQVMNADGTDQRRLTDSYDSHPSWSPDGGLILFASGQQGVNDTGRIKTIDVLSREISSVSKLYSSMQGPSHPDWSPDGGRIAIMYEYEILTMSANGGATKEVVQIPGEGGMFSPDWSADSRQIVFALDYDAISSNFDIYRVDADGSNLVQLTSHEAHDREPAWSPDGTQIAFASRRDGNWELYVMNTDGGDIQNISNSPDSEQHPAWSPDGTRIAFQSNRDGNWEVYVMNADGTDVQRLTDNDVKDQGPEWRP